jgi:hypothetical protein
MHRLDRPVSQDAGRRTRKPRAAIICRCVHCYAPDVRVRLSLQCSSPGGCGTHFCYKCGEVIVRSAPAHETREAVQAHYSRCTMLEFD